MSWLGFDQNQPAQKQLQTTLFLLDADDDQPDVNFLKKKLSDFDAIKSGCVMIVEDWLQDIEIELTLIEKTENDDFDENFKIVDTKKAKTKLWVGTRLA